MFRYFSLKKQDEYFLIEKNDFHHLKNVVCLKEKELVEIVYQQDLFVCEVFVIEKTYALLKEVKKILTFNKNQCEKTLLIGLIKGERWDYMLQKCVELGVDKIIPVNFQRNVVKISDEKINKKVERWQKICEAAAKQSKRLTIPLIYRPINLDQVKNYQSDLNIVAWEKVNDVFLANVLNDNKFNSISFIIGPEGGIDQQEIEILKTSKFIPISLGNNILRAETAPLYILTILSYLKL